MQLSIKDKLLIAAGGTIWLGVVIWYVAFSLSGLVFAAVSIIIPVALLLLIGRLFETRLHNPEAARRLGKATISFSREQIRVGEEFGVSVSLAPPEPIRIESATLQLIFCESRAQPGTRAIPIITVRNEAVTDAQERKGLDSGRDGICLEHSFRIPPEAMHSFAHDVKDKLLLDQS